MGHDAGVAVIPVYDVGPDAAVVMAENAAIYGCARVLIGTSRKGAVYHLIKGHFQRRLEALHARHADLPRAMRLLWGTGRE